MLRIDETSKTLVAPQAGGLVTEGHPDREELLALLAALVGCLLRRAGSSEPAPRGGRARPGPRHPRLRRARRPRRRRPGDGSIEFSEVGRALAAAAQVASWDANALSAVNDSLSAAVPHDSPQVVLIAGGFDAATIATVEWLARRHGVELSCFAVSFLRFGSERLLTVRREFPPRDAQRARPGRRGPAAARRAGSGRRGVATASAPPRPARPLPVTTSRRGGPAGRGRAPGR